ncbi:5-oxoprolinase subunit C family protein [Sporosarcina saromensis]|uniref:Biotin-dependent carboxyltransferase family protein n=1 Tax=Sporosarcina saromensis TaxID=359365 RepID=A0ABU4GI11_9BACL|nr:biotin-dependent carboxyltransferase family protein [Sporosarcina saromensis]MDW0115252.1 biotin-dependent carboxyltransferase family protein [Sporosarcina saromensis]
MITVMKAGLQDTIQDLGRYGYQKFGVIVGGVMDPYSHRIANLLVGNEEHMATLEMTLVGPHLLMEQDLVIAICGGDLQPSIDGERVPMWKPVFVQKGSVVKFGAALAGSRAYLAVAGGFDVPDVLNSRTTYLKARIGGYEGRALKKADKLATGKPLGIGAFVYKRLQTSEVSLPFRSTDWKIASKLLPNLSKHYEIRVMRGRQYDLFTEESQQRFWQEPFTVSSQSDRMGYRMSGPTLTLKVSAELVSEAVTYGSIQVPSDGNPIILAADKQTTGGYPKIGQIASVNFTKLAQAKAGDQLTFTEVTIEQSQLLVAMQEMSLKALRAAIENKFR